MFYWSNVSEQNNDTAWIPNGADWYYFFEFDLFAESTIEVEYQETTSSPVYVYLFNSIQYDTYSEGIIMYPSDSLFSDSASSGRFEYTVSSAGKYFVVFTHAGSTVSNDQYIEVDIETHGFDVVTFTIGVILLAVSLIASFAGFRMKKKENPPRSETSTH